MVECQKGQHDVVCQWSILAKWQRFWFDLEHKAVYGSALGHSLRQMRDEWSAELGGAVGLRSINERINQLEALAKQSHQRPLQQVPPVVQFDGIWLNLTPTY